MQMSMAELLFAYLTVAQEMPIRRQNHTQAGLMKGAEIYEALGQAIRAYREQKRMTQGELADLVEMSRASVTNIELGRQSVLVDQLYRFAHALGAQPADLLRCTPPGHKKDRPVEELTPEITAWIDRARRKVA
jgi:DNA-binding XRE family transcriptional regulator